MRISYKNFLKKGAHHVSLVFSLESQEKLTEVQNQLEQIFNNSNNLISSNDLGILYEYCKESDVDDFGVNLFLFTIVFFENNDEDDDLTIIHLLMETLQLPSFNPIFFLNSECINCLINHIYSNNIYSKYAIIFLINLLYKTNEREFLKDTNFFDMFQTEKKGQEENSHLQDLIFAFFSQTEEIDQDMFNRLYPYISQLIFMSMDINKMYRYLTMVLSLANNGINIENIDVIINNIIDSKEDFMVEIILFLIQYSKNPQNFFDYIIFNFENKFYNDSIIKASIRAFNYCWMKFSIEQKNQIAQIISSSIAQMPYSLRFICVSFICNVESWNIFNDIIFFDEIFNFISQKDISMRCLDAIYQLLSFDIQNSELNMQKINILLSHYEDLNDIAFSSDEPENMIAQMLVDSISEIREENCVEIF